MFEKNMEWYEDHQIEVVYGASIVGGVVGCVLGYKLTERAVGKAVTKVLKDTALVMIKPDNTSNIAIGAFVG